MAALSFQVEQKDAHSDARTGNITTDHGTIRTPIFMPVGTVGSVKAVNQQQLESLVKAQIILGNTYHLYLRPGTSVLQGAGGLHQFIGWNRPILTDSGGYQVFSLAANRKIREEGVLFQSHIDGSRHMFTPENVIDIQRDIGADIMMAFDECTPYPCEYRYAKESVEMTHRWLERCIARVLNTEDKYPYTQNLFPIVQGSTYEDLRRASCDFAVSKDAAGYAIGGLSVGEPEGVMYQLTALCTDNLPQDKPRYLMGVGTPWNLLECIALGVDMFDCVMPTRNGRNGMLFTTEGVINIRNKKWATDYSPVDPALPCEMSNYYSKAYLRHLFVSGEILALEIATIQNLTFYLWLMQEARIHIEAGDYMQWKAAQSEVFRRRL